MSFGMALTDNNSSLVIDSDSISFGCVYSGEVEGSFNFNGLSSGDVVCFTSLDSALGGVAELYKDSSIKRLFAFGNHRVVVFRPSFNLPLDTYGLELFNTSAERVFSSKYPLMLLAGEDTTYHSLANPDWSTVCIVMLGGPDGVVVEFQVDVVSVNQAGLKKNTQYYNHGALGMFLPNDIVKNYNDAFSDVTLSQTSRPISVDIGNIPLSFETGLVSTSSV